jgi:phosphoribosylamine--glycine ligase
MRVLLLEESADGLLDLAIRAWRYGHDVRYHVGSFDRVKHPTGMGLVERVADWRPSALGWADLVIAGGNGKWMRALDAVRARGVPMIGGNSEAAQLELDRLAGMAAFRRAGIAVPPFRQCRTLDEAIRTVEERGEGFAAKPCGSVGDKSLSFVGKSAEETLWRLRRWKKEGKRFPCGLMLQELVRGVEFAVGAWFGPHGFAPGWEENFETKRMAAGDLGPNTGEMGTVMRLVTRSKLADEVLKPLEAQLERLGWVGNVDVNCIVDEDGTPWPLEFTMRCGWPSTSIELALHDGDPIEFLAGVAMGKPPKTRRLDEIVVGIVLALPPYPFGHEKAPEVVGVPIWGITDGILDDLHFADVMAGSGTDFATAGSYVLVATGTGSSVSHSRNQALRVLNRLKIPASPFWRIDIGNRLRGQLEALQRHGFARDLLYA